MKAKMILFLLVLVLLLLAVTPVLAAPGGVVEPHDPGGPPYGPEFGRGTAAAASSSPRAIPIHKGILPE
jgi:hypothetical protein